MSDQSQYEILSDNGRIWNVEAIATGSDAATKLAHELKGREGAMAVKVVQISFNNAAGEFREREVLFLGERRRTVRKQDDELSKSVLCRSLEDLFLGQSRQAIRRVLRQWLDTNRLTPIELLHHSENIKQFEDTGTVLQSAAQRVAMAQASAFNQDVKVRQREIHDLIDKASAKASALSRSGNCPLIQDDDLDALVDRLGDDGDKDYLFNAALTNWLRGIPSSSEKLIALLKLATNSKKPATTAHLDEFLTDFFGDANSVAMLIGEQQCLGDAILHLAELVNPGPVPKAGGAGSVAAADADAAVQASTETSSKSEDIDYENLDVVENISALPVMRVFRDMLRRGRFPKCRQILIRRIQQTLSGPRQLGTEGPLADAQLLARLYNRLSDEDGKFVMDSDLKEAFVERSRRYVSGDAVGRMLEGVAEPLHRVPILLKAEPGIFGKFYRQRIGDYVIAILKEPDNQAALRGTEQSPALNMRNLGAIQRLILESGLSNAQKQNSSAILDSICTELLHEGQILSRIAERSPSRIDECISILKLCAAGTFTETRAAETARKRVVAVLRAPGFAEAFTRRADDNAEIKTMLAELETLMSKSGISLDNP